MTGPMPRGHWMSHVEPESWDILQPGRRYQITQSFRDYDHFEHPAGETWTYLGFSFLPYDDGLSLFVSLDGDQEWHIRMQLRAEEQSPIVDHLQNYMMLLAPPPPPPLRPSPPTVNRSPKAPLILLGVSFAAVLLAFVLFAASERSPSFVVPGGASIVYALAGVAAGVLGLLGGLIATIWIVRKNGRSHA
jgi:hypothetical protein